MPVTGQKRNDSMQQLNSVDQTRIQDRNFGAEWYDSTGGQTYSLGSGTVVVNLDTERLNTAPSVYVMASDILTLTEAGIYLFNAQVTTKQNGGSSSVNSRIWLEQDPATGSFAEVLGSMSYFSHAPIPASSVTGVISLLLRAGIDYRYRLCLEEAGGSSPLITLINASKLSVMRLWQNG